MAFDPCREWLGIDAVDLGDPCRVLGLAPGCCDPAAIGNAADGRLQALRQVNPGPFAKAHAALVARVEEARDTLLATAFSAGASAPAPERRSSFAPPPVPLTAPNPRWGHAEDAPSIAPPLAPTAEADTEPVLGPIVRRTTVRRRSSSSGFGGILVTLLALLTTAVVVLVFLMLRPNPFLDPAPVKKPTPVNQARDDIPINPGRTATDPQPRPRKPAASEPLVAESPAPPPAPEGLPARDEEDVAGDREMGVRGQVAQDSASRNEQGTEIADQQASAGREGAENPRRQEPATNAVEPREDQERARMQEAVDSSLGAAYKAIQRGEFDTADRLIAAAVAQVGDDVEAATRIERWRLFATYAREFVGYREQAIAAANEGRDYEFGGTRFAVIEIRPDLFIYKLAGKIERVPADQVDPRIEMAVVEGWFAADGRAANHLFLGARWLCFDPPNLNRARAEWRIAGDGGEQVAPLLALLEDSVIRGSGR